ncbi:hypothetical protein [Lignipirellula cremea]|uniref:Uncharacterized protein n=1 Tax=Lignipirellula cremea TaxID=2528010 RepID=A0A518DPR6_9BACT|nr:hypothetical protein [Lignipirellula cremea]QDU93813.1 hypothetical protein Pla8534_15960 [Lignipirellula cremea]
MKTPEFIGWTLVRSCPLREVLDDPADPMAVERLLRPVQAYSDARREGRLFEGVCLAADVIPDVDPSPVDDHAAAIRAANGEPLGFRADEVLAAYGGEQAIRSVCTGCPANAVAQVQADALAGCVGLLEFSPHDASLHADFQRAYEAAEQAGETQEILAATTQPAWYGIWIEPAPTYSQRTAFRAVFRRLAGQNGFYAQRLAPLLAALDLSLDCKLPAPPDLRWELFPHGEVHGRRWRLGEHCPCCKADWKAGSRRCAVCGRQGGSQAARRRHARGVRPYWRLAGFLGEANVGRFLERYAAARTDSESVDQVPRGSDPPGEGPAATEQR